MVANRTWNTYFRPTTKPYMVTLFVKAFKPRSLIGSNSILPYVVRINVGFLPMVSEWNSLPGLLFHSSLIFPLPPPRKTSCP